jgi:hypothetical protein
MPGPGAEAITACEHVYASHHEPGHRVYWVRQCMICNHVDWNDLDEQIDTLRAEAAASERARIRQLAMTEGTRHVYAIASGALYDFADLLREPESHADALGNPEPPETPDRPSQASTSHPGNAQEQL